jgi:hypothetical protein
MVSNMSIFISMILLKTLLTEKTLERTPESATGLGDLYKLFRHRDDITLILNTQDANSREKYGLKLVAKLGGKSKAEKTVLGALKSVSRIAGLVKPFLPEELDPLDLPQTKLFFSAMGFSTSTVNKASWAVSVVCKKLGVPIYRGS